MVAKVVVVVVVMVIEEKRSLKIGCVREEEMKLCYFIRAEPMNHESISSISMMVIASGLEQKEGNEWPKPISLKRWRWQGLLVSYLVQEHSRRLIESLAAPSAKAIQILDQDQFREKNNQT